MLVTFKESDMEFEFEENNLFRIEKSEIYMNLQNDFKIAEFLLYQPESKRLIVLEAKTTAPNPQSKPNENEQEIKTRQKNFEDYITQIYDKLLNALTLGVTICLERYEDGKNELPANFQSITFNDIEIALVLVIKKQKIEWLPPVQEYLQKKLRSATKAWKCKVFVMNEGIAKINNLIK